MIGTDIDYASILLTGGELVAIPTETVYGLAANAFSESAVARIYKVKNRPQFNPLIIHTNSLDKLKKWGLSIPPEMEKLMAHFSPGPLTYVIPKSYFIPDIVTAGTDAVAVRIPNHTLTLQLLSKLDFPLAAPSANPSGYISPTTAQHVEQQLGSQIPYILDGGSSEVGLESTIISFLNPIPEILRHGGLSMEKIESVIGKVLDKVAQSGEQITTDNPVAPGMLARHYAPRTRLLHGDIRLLLDSYNPQKVALITFKDIYEHVPYTNQFVLSPSGNLDEAASKLFAAMRKADALGVELILAEVFPDKELGKAINDRLRRAAV